MSKQSYRVSFLDFREHMLLHSCPHCKHYKIMKDSKLRIPIVCVDCFGNYVEDRVKCWSKDDSKMEK